MRKWSAKLSRATGRPTASRAHNPLPLSLDLLSPATEPLPACVSNNRAEILLSITPPGVLCSTRTRCPRCRLNILTAPPRRSLLSTYDEENFFFHYAAACLYRVDCGATSAHPRNYQSDRSEAEYCHSRFSRQWRRGPVHGRLQSDCGAGYRRIRRG